MPEVNISAHTLRPRLVDLMEPKLYLLSVKRDCRKRRRLHRSVLFFCTISGNVNVSYQAGDIGHLTAR